MAPSAEIAEPDVALPQASAASFVSAAKAAFEAGDEDRGDALLAVALDRRPSDAAALAEAQRRFKIRCDQAMEAADWVAAAAAVEGYDATVREAFGDVETPPEVEPLLERRASVEGWRKELADKVAEETPEVAPPEADADRLSREITSLEQEVQSEAVDEAGLEEFAERAGRIYAEAMTLKLDGTEVGDLPRRARAVSVTVGERLKTHTVSLLRTEADAAVAKAISAANGHLEAAHNEEKIARTHYATSVNPAGRWEKVGQKLVEADRVLAGVSALASSDRIREAQERSQQIGREAVAARAAQQKSYNLWAIGEREDAIEHSLGNKGYFNDDEEAFKRLLKDTIAHIDPQHLHPATFGLYNEIFQKLISELDEREKVAMTRAVEAAEAVEKRSLAEF